MRRSLAVICFGVSSFVSAGPARLAEELYAAGDWTGCRRECQRILMTDTEQGDVRFLGAWAAHREWPGDCSPPTTNGVSSAMLLAVRSTGPAQAPALTPVRHPCWNQWGISFYRRQVRPALGGRCALHPSCSEYFLQASTLHGWIAFPMIADRLVRERTILREARQVVEVGGDFKVSDPVSDHDRWFGHRAPDGRTAD